MGIARATEADGFARYREWLDRGYAGAMIVEGQVPLAELEGYSARLKSMTQGRGAWTMSLSHYEQAPPNLQQQLATEYKSKGKVEDEE